MKIYSLNQKTPKKKKNYENISKLFSMSIELLIASKKIISHPNK